MNPLKTIFRWIGYILTFFFVSSIASVVVLKFMPVYYTPLMLIRCGEQIADGDTPKIEHEWMPLDSMPHSMPQAVMASEDNRFLEHNGFDFREIYKARLEAMDGGRERGASTISQQTAKNVFLWPGHSWVRKGLEAYFTVLIENIWGKKRIMEVYLNSIEMGNGIYGVKAVSHEHFNKEPHALSKRDAALIAASLPNPRERDSGNPTGKMIRRGNSIVDLMGKIKDADWGRKRSD